MVREEAVLLDMGAFSYCSPAASPAAGAGIQPVPPTAPAVSTLGSYAPQSSQLSHPGSKLTSSATADADANDAKAALAARPGDGGLAVSGVQTHPGAGVVACKACDKAAKLLVSLSGSSKPPVLSSGAGGLAAKGRRQGRLSQGPPGGAAGWAGPGGGGQQRNVGGGG